MEASLKRKGWLIREIEVLDGDTITTLMYSGRGFGTEKVVIGDSELIGRSPYGWFVPIFEASTRDGEYVVQVRIWPLLAIRSLAISKDGKLIYSEGPPPYQVTRATESIQLLIAFSFIIVPALLLLWFL